MKDETIKKIYEEFDQAEKALKEDKLDETILNLYKNIHARTLKGEFNKEQLELIQARAKKSTEFVQEIKRELTEQALENSERYQKMQSYLKNSF